MAAHIAAASAGAVLQMVPGACRFRSPGGNSECALARSPGELGRRLLSRPVVAAPGRRDAAVAEGGVKEVRGGWKDPFDFGVPEELDNGDVLSEGKQTAEDPIPGYDDESPYGYLDFPAFYNPEIASLGSYLRGDVRKCACIVHGGVYENLLFFPVIQLLKDRYPGVKIDTYASARGKQTYELNKNVRRAFVHPVNVEFVEPVEFMDIIGKFKNEYYDLILSTKLSGMGHAWMLWLSDSRENVSYVYPNVNGAFADLFLSSHFKAPRLNLAEGGYNMYTEMIEFVGKPGPGLGRQLVQPLYVNVSRKLQEVVQTKYDEPGSASRGDYLVFHGMESDSEASMTSWGDTDSLLPLSVWAQIASGISTKVVVVIPHKKDTLRVYEHLGVETSVCYITTPGQLAALIYDSIGVVSTNTAALQLAIALKKPSVALFSSEEKAELFLPPHAENVKAIASRTGKLAGIDVNSVVSSVSAIADNLRKAPGEHMTAEAFQKVCSLLLSTLMSSLYIINSGRGRPNADANGRPVGSLP